MFPLLALAALGVAIAAGTAKAQPSARITPRTSQRSADLRRRRLAARRNAAAKRARRTRARLKVVKPSKSAMKATVRAIRKRMTSRERRALSKIKAIDVVPATKKGAQILRNLFRLAAKKQKTVHPSLAKAARGRIAKLALIARRAKKAGKATPLLRSVVAKKMPVAAKQQIVKEVVRAETTTEPTPAQAAKALQIYCKNGGYQGSRNNRPAIIKNSQRLMGLTNDGIIGPKTRRRAKELGYPLPPRRRR